MKRTMFTLLAAAFAATLPTLGCLVYEEIHTLYLAPEGTVTWTVLEKDVRSDSPDPGVARQEEEEFLEQSWTGNQPAAGFLRQYSPDSLRTSILRDESPFMVMTEARFASADILARAILDRWELQGDADLQTAGGMTRLTVRLHPPAEEEFAATGTDEDPRVGTDDSPGSPDDEYGKLATFLGRHKIVLTRGKFVAGHGFHLSGDRREACVEVMTVKEQGEPDGSLVYWLTWEFGEGR